MAAQPKATKPRTAKVRTARPQVRALTPSYRATAAAGKTVWLTFDDGPHPRHTAKVLDILSKHGVRATFFVIGKNAASFPALVERMRREGHRVGNHTHRHPDLTKLSTAKVREEITLAERAIGAALGKQKLFRPPYGAHNAKVDGVIAALGYRTLLWNVDTVDWSPKFKPDKWVAHGLEQIRARAKSVVLNHDIHKTTADHLDTFIRRIKTIKGATFADPALL